MNEILDNKKKSWALIDCKTFGKEFNNSKEKTTTDWKKNQLLSYFLNEKDISFLSKFFQRPEKERPKSCLLNFHSKRETSSLFV